MGGRRGRGEGGGRRESELLAVPAELLRASRVSIQPGTRTLAQQRSCANAKYQKLTLSLRQYQGYG